MKAKWEQPFKASIQHLVGHSVQLKATAATTVVNNQSSGAQRVQVELIDYLSRPST